MASSTSAVSTIAFNGSSSYSSDFQTQLNRAVQLASLPEQQMQNNVNDMTNQQQALAGMESNFVSLQGAIENITATAQGSPSATVQGSSAVTATASSTALAGNYSIQVDNVGSSTTTLSNAPSTPVTDPTTGNISAATSFTLTVNGANTTITPSGTSLEDLATAINSSDAGVQATIVNLGGSSSPDYRLAVTSTELGPDSIQLSDGTNLLNNISTGSLAQYKLNGGSTDVQSNSSTVTIAPGLTVNLAQTTSSPVTITVSNDFSGLSSALANFASAYNSTVDAVAGQVGQNGGALAGQSIIYTLNNILSSISQYSGSGSGSIASLSDLGLAIDSTGHLSFSQSTFASANTSAIQQFLGSANSGFLQAANNAVTSATDSTTGVITGEANDLQTQIANENTQIAQEQSRITDLQNNLQQQLSAADATIANLQAQKTYYTNLFAAEYLQNTPAGG